jgi:transcriptional regulator with XRE-family HTH domain
MDIKKELGEKIKRVRKSKGITQEQLAEMIDISPRNLSNIEVGGCFVKSETLEKIIEALNITTEELFANEHIKSNVELLKSIDNCINLVKNDHRSLGKIYRILKCLIEDI